jgi:hypothetical protein
MAPVAPRLVKTLHRRLREAARAGPGPLGTDEMRIYTAARRRAERAGLAFRLREDEFSLLVARAGGRCEETRLPFDDRKVKGLRYRPHRMSLDRLSNASGYTLPNLRLVHAIVNMTRGAATLQQMAVMKYLGLAATGAAIDDSAILRRGADPEAWNF